MEVISGMYELVKAMFSVFAAAVSSYPFTTVLVFAFLLYWMVEKAFISFPKKWREDGIPHFTIKDAFFIAVWFIVSTVLAHFVGAVFAFVASALGIVLRVAGGATSPFETHPLPFTAVLLILSALAAIFVLIITGGRIRSASYILVFSLAFATLFLTYIITTLYVAMTAA